MSYYSKHVFICTNQKAEGKPCCANTGGQPFFDAMKSKLVALGLHGQGKIRISKSGCLGRCESGPWMVVYPEGTWHSYTSHEDIDKIIEQIV